MSASFESDVKHEVLSFVPSTQRVLLPRPFTTPEFHLVDVTTTNIDEVFALTIDKEQTRFVERLDTIAAIVNENVLRERNNNNQEVSFVAIYSLAHKAHIGIIILSELPTPHGPKIVFVNDFLIDRRFQGKGIGSRSFDAIIEYIRASSLVTQIDSIEMRVHKRNYRAWVMYENKHFIFDYHSHAGNFLSGVYSPLPPASPVPKADPAFHQKHLFQFRKALSDNRLDDARALVRIRKMPIPDTANEVLGFGNTTPLCEMAQRGDRNEAIRMLVTEMQASVDQHEPNGRTALYFASQNGNTEAVDTLLRLKASPNVVNRDPSHKSPLYISIVNGHMQIAAKLAVAGADPNHQVAGESMTMIMARLGKMNQFAELVLTEEQRIRTGTKRK